MIVKLLTEHHLEFLSLKGGCRGSPESTHVKMLYCWKSHVMVHMIAPLVADMFYYVSLNLQNELRKNWFASSINSMVQKHKC